MEENKFSILHKSKALFEQFGYAKTTLTDIAQSVGKVKTAIYYYFSGKEEIFAELVKLEAAEFYQKLKKATEKVESPLGKLEIYIDQRIALMKTIAQRYHFLKKEFFELMPIVEENRGEYYLKEIRMVLDILIDGKKKKEFNVVSEKFAAEMLVNTLKGLEIQMFVTEKILITNKNKIQFRDFILHGILQNKN